MDASHYVYRLWDQESGRYIRQILTVGYNGITEEMLDFLQQCDNAEAQDYEDDVRHWDELVEDFKESFFRGSSNQTDVEILLTEVLPKLTDDQRNLVYDLLGNDFNLADLARRDGVSYQAIQNRFSKIKKRVKKIFSELGR